MLDMLRAHGLEAGPTQRPVLAGAICGPLADMAALPLLHLFGTFDRLAPQIGGMSVWMQIASTALAGAGYGLLFQRGANDVRGGWLFGLAYGYLVWQALAVPALQWIPAHPLLDGRPAQGLLLAHLVWGLAAGVLFPLVHRPFKARVDSSRWVTRTLFGERSRPP